MAASDSSALSEYPSVDELYLNGALKVYNPSIRVNNLIRLTFWDITKIPTDAIVNAANKSLMGGGGVDGAIWRAAGHSFLREECTKLGGCDTGSAKMTGGGALPAKHIIHAVGPIYSASKPERSRELLASCYRTCMQIAEQAGLKSIAFPCISTGAYGYPIREAAQVALAEVRKFLEDSNDREIVVVFCTYSKRDEEIYKEEIPKIFPVSEWARRP